MIACGTVYGDFVGFTADGSLTEWGVSLAGLPANPGNAAFVPSSTPGGVDGFSYAVEDGTSGSWGYVGPGYGGQNYDWEAMYVTYDSSNVYVAIVTGTDQAGQYAWSTSQRHYPGDIFVDFGDDGSWELAIETGHAGTAGAMYSGPGTWWTNPTDYPSSAPSEINYGTSPTLQGNASFFYSNAVTGDDNLLAGTSTFGDHNVIELSFARNNGSGDWLAGCDSFTVHWTQDCGNDLARVNVDMPVPEPGTVVMVGSVLAGLLGARRMKRA